MKTLPSLLLLFGLFLCTCGRAQDDAPLRYFQFRLGCGHGNWQDTAIVAATNDSSLIAAFEREVAKPFDERQLINGPIAHGDGGHNANADHRFAWHYLPNQWELVDRAIEVCSGCPYTDLDADPVYWVDTLGLFCPWSARPVREIEEPLTDVGPDPIEVLPASVYPNPIRTHLTIDLGSDTHATVSLRDLLGRTRLQLAVYGVGNRIDVQHLPRGPYFIELRSAGGARNIRQIILQ